MEENPKEDLEQISHRIKDYIKLQLEIIQLKATEKGVRMVAYLITYLVLGLFVILFLLAGFLALGFYFAQVTGSNAAGFGCLSLILLLLVVILFIIKNKTLIKPLENKFIENIFKNW
ncbi:MAG: hypothetical protein EAZ51_02280 [Sphingobacteriales bacterium]|nr:MAG: hypothetical protein EAZ64_02115 [Sphingobacteriales bacterium]TAF82555.1 MAG: hypothetical protein EAZ51_02280 [Sphingobacteriales bacterium]